jgi:pimeloyl-ACP methyl ester carboxylesterase
VIKFSTAVLGMALLLPSIAVAQASASPGRFETTACPPEVAAGERIDCGLLIVPENRKAPASRTIRLPVIVMRSRATSPAPDPVLFLAGGPGNSNTGGPRSGKGNPFLDTRDQVLLEPRGARRAAPALDCPEINAAQDRIAAGSPKGQAGLVSAATTCRVRLTATGIDLNGYTSAETADDIEDLRTALGYGKLNLYAFSYGTRLALTFVRRHPDSVRSLVLDSVLPPEVNYDEAASANVRRALNAVFEGCAADPACGRAYPDLPRRFTSLIAKADREPLVIPSAEPGGAALRADGRLVAGAIAAALEDPAMIPTIPKVIGEASAGRYEALAPLIARSRAPSTFTWGLRLSVWCAEEAPFEDPVLVEAQVAPSQGLGGLDARTTPPEVCRAWNVDAAPAVENQAVKSDVPALIFAGEFDPATPPGWGRRLLANMPNTSFVEMPGRSHGASFNGCGGKMAVAFITDPTTPLRADCALKQSGPDFGAGLAK